MSKSTSNDPTKRKPPPETDRRIICTVCHQYNLPCNYFPGESQCDTCFSLGRPCIPYDGSSNAAIATADYSRLGNNIHGAAAVGMTPASSSYNQFVAQSYSSANQNPKSRYAAPLQQHLSSHYGAIPPQWPQQQHHYNRGLSTTAAAAGLSQQYPHGMYTNHPAAAVSITPYNNTQPRTNQIIQSFATARYAARALNGGIEPTNPQIVEMMELMHSSSGGGADAAGGGGGGMVGTSSALIPGYSNDVNRGHMSLDGAGGDGATGGDGNENSSRQQLPPDASQGAANTPSFQPPKAKRQRIQTQQQQQQQPHFATGTILPNYNSVIPSATNRGGVKWMSSRSVVENITRRVRDECAYLCLLPTEDFVPRHEGGEGSSNSSSSSRRGKSSSQWLRCAVTLIYSLLNLESPNPVGWDDENTAATAAATTATTAGKRNKHWLKGIYHKLHGPQPWQCTRPFIVKAVYQLLLAEGYTDWLMSEHRWKEFVQ